MERWEWSLVLALVCTACGPSIVETGDSEGGGGDTGAAGDSDSGAASGGGGGSDPTDDGESAGSSGDGGDGSGSPDDTGGSPGSSLDCDLPDVHGPDWCIWDDYCGWYEEGPTTPTRTARKPPDQEIRAACIRPAPAACMECVVANCPGVAEMTCNGFRCLDLFSSADVNNDEPSPACDPLMECMYPWRTAPCYEPCAQVVDPEVEDHPTIWTVQLRYQCDE